MAKIFYNFDIDATENGYLVLEHGILQHMVGELKTESDLDLWLEDHASIRGLGPENYKLNFLPKPLKSREILDRTFEICEKSKYFGDIGLDMSAIKLYCEHIVELRKWKLELETTEITGENINTIDNCKIVVEYCIKSWEAMVRYVAKQYIL